MLDRVDRTPRPHDDLTPPAARPHEGDRPRPRLSAQEDWVLGEAVQAGRRAARRLAEGDTGVADRPALEATVAAGSQARETLVLAHLWLAAYFADRLAWSGIPREDLRQEAVIGLLTAADGYDPGRRLRFATYAGWRIRAALGRALERRGPITLPKHLAPRLRALRPPATDGPPATAALAELTPPAPDPLRRALAAARPMVWLDDRAATGPWDEATGRDDRAAAARVHALLAALEERERAIIRLRYGLDGEPQSRRAVATRLGVSDEWVRRLEHRAMAKLRLVGAEATPRPAAGPGRRPLSDGSRGERAAARPAYAGDSLHVRAPRDGSATDRSRRRSAPAG